MAQKSGYGCKCGRTSRPPPGTEFLDAETGRQKQSPKCANAHRDKDLRNEWPEIPAETPYLASYRKRAVCGDWMVVCAVICEPVSNAAFPANRAITGNFSEIGLLEVLVERRNLHAAGLLRRFLLKINSEKILRIQGNASRRSGKATSQKGSSCSTCRRVDQSAEKALKCDRLFRASHRFR
jgi:hypothetical protein